MCSPIGHSTARSYSTFNPLIVRNVTQAMTFTAHFVPWTSFTGPVGIVNLTSGGLELLDPGDAVAARAVLCRTGL